MSDLVVAAQILQRRQNCVDRAFVHEIKIIATEQGRDRFLESLEQLKDARDKSLAEVRRLGDFQTTACTVALAVFEAEWLAKQIRFGKIELIKQYLEVIAAAQKAAFYFARCELKVEAEDVD